MTTQMTIEDFYKYINETLSKNTVAQYRIGINAFSEWYKKTPNEIDRHFKNENLFLI